MLTAASSQRREWPRWPQWAALQNELAALDDVVHVAALYADHNVHLADPGIVIREVRELVKWRRSSPAPDTAPKTGRRDRLDDLIHEYYQVTGDGRMFPGTCSARRKPSSRV